MRHESQGEQNRQPMRNLSQSLGRKGDKSCLAEEKKARRRKKPFF